MANTEIRQMLKSDKIAYWEIGQVLGLHENTILRKLRTELTETDKKSFAKAIGIIKAKRKTA